MKEKIKQTMENLEKNNMRSYYVEKKEEVLPLIKGMLREGDKITVGGSVSLFECGVIDFLKNGPYQYLDRYEEGISRDQIEKIFSEAFTSDVFLCSSNAITETGELYNVDGNCNRIAAIAYGPKSVIIVAGMNKIVKNIEEAILRVKQAAAPKNTRRLSCGTYCKAAGHCVKNTPDFSGCTSEQRICCGYLVSSRQRQKGRIKVILVGEEVGY